MQLSSSDAIFNKVVLAVEQTLQVERHSLSPATRLVDDLALGRFGRIRLAMYLEQAFGLEISNDAIECFDTVGDIAHYMRRWALGNEDFSSRSWLRA